MSHRLVYGRLLLATAITSFGLGITQAVQAEHQEQQKVGLGGYCAVCIVDANKWEKGTPEFSSTYDGVSYYFPSAAIREKFDATPARYVPALNGDCIVCYAKMGKRVPGNLNHAAFYNNRVYLFPSAQEKNMFMANAEQFINADLAAEGNCVVCQVMANKQVPGTAEFTEIHNGLRYQFPSAREAAVFRSEPTKYVAARRVPVANGNKMMVATHNTSTKQQPMAQEVSFTGRSGCAACEHGVHPLSNPKSLGLAVNTLDGRVVVIEGADRNYPGVYAARYGGRTLHVSGKVLKTQGKFTWLEPTSVTIQ